MADRRMLFWTGIRTVGSGNKCSLGDLYPFVLVNVIEDSALFGLVSREKEGWNGS